MNLKPGDLLYDAQATTTIHRLLVANQPERAILNFLHGIGYTPNTARALLTKARTIIDHAQTAKTRQDTILQTALAGYPANGYRRPVLARKGQAA